MTTVVQEDTKTQEHYWNRMTQFKFDLNYYSYYFSYCVNFLRYWKITVSVLTALVTGAYDELVADLIETNIRMIEYKKLMKKIAFQEK